MPGKRTRQAEAVSVLTSIHSGRPPSIDDRQSISAVIDEYSKYIARKKSFNDDQALLYTFRALHLLQRLSNLAPESSYALTSAIENALQFVELRHGPKRDARADELARIIVAWSEAKRVEEIDLRRANLPLPAKYDERLDSAEGPVDFYLRVYRGPNSPFVSLVRHEVRKLDRKLVKALENKFLGSPSELDVLLPSKRSETDALLAAQGIVPGSPSQRRRKAAEIRRHQIK